MSKFQQFSSLNKPPTCNLRRLLVAVGGERQIRPPSESDSRPRRFLQQTNGADPWPNVENAIGFSAPASSSSATTPASGSEAPPLARSTRRRRRRRSRWQRRRRRRRRRSWASQGRRKQARRRIPARTQMPLRAALALTLWPYASSSPPFVVAPAARGVVGAAARGAVHLHLRRLHARQARHSIPPPVAIPGGDTLSCRRSAQHPPSPLTLEVCSPSPCRPVRGVRRDTCEMRTQTKTTPNASAPTPGGEYAWNASAAGGTSCMLALPPPVFIRASCKGPAPGVGPVLPCAAAEKNGTPSLASPARNFGSAGGGQGWWSSLRVVEFAAGGVTRKDHEGDEMEIRVVVEVVAVKGDEKRRVERRGKTKDGCEGPSDPRDTKGRDGAPNKASRYRRLPNPLPFLPKRSPQMPEKKPTHYVPADCPRLLHSPRCAHYAQSWRTRNIRSRRVVVEGQSCGGKIYQHFANGRDRMEGKEGGGWRPDARSARSPKRRSRRVARARARRLLLCTDELRRQGEGEGGCERDARRPGREEDGREGWDEAKEEDEEGREEAEREEGWCPGPTGAVWR
ncbi:hypothetical protein B0H19DRAFT_1068295 [Mycena capillaripes]|nr:hypothetical protein B0H19DRAFT_1068295 [Mycena capillaripes]